MPADGSPLPDGTVLLILTPKIVSRVTASRWADRVSSWADGPIVAEGEMAVVIAKEVHNASPKRSGGSDSGDAWFNDVTALEFFTPSGDTNTDFFRSKSIESFASLGLVGADRCHL